MSAAERSVVAGRTRDLSRPEVAPFDAGAPAGHRYTLVGPVAAQLETVVVALDIPPEHYMTGGNCTGGYNAVWSVDCACGATFESRGETGPEFVAFREHKAAGNATHVWWWRAKRPDRKGQSCRIVTRGALGSILVEFPDGERVVTSRWAVRRAVAS